MSHPSWNNYAVLVPGTTVMAHLGQHVAYPERWSYSLWSSQGDDETFVASDHLSLPGLAVTPEQVARIAFLLSVEYA